MATTKANLNESKRKLKIVVSRDLGPKSMSVLSERTDLQVVVRPEDRVDREPRRWLLDNVPGAIGLLVLLGDKVDQELLDVAGRDLRVVSTMSVGYEHVDVATLEERGIKLGYTPDVLTDAVADLNIMLALMAGRNVKATMGVVQNDQWPSHQWSPFGFCGPQLSATPSSPSRTVGFLGFGRIAQATLARLIPFGITRFLYASNPLSPHNKARDSALAEKYHLDLLRRVDLDELARASDVVFVLAPGGAATRHVVNEGFLGKMKRDGILVNTSRGTLVDSDALAKALGEGWIWGAGLDVVDGEPNITSDHPLVKEPRCVIVPHIGSATTETRFEMAMLAVRNLIGGISGEAMPAPVIPSSRK